MLAPFFFVVPFFLHRQIGQNSYPRRGDAPLRQTQGHRNVTKTRARAQCKIIALLASERTSARMAPARNPNRTEKQRETPNSTRADTQGPGKEPGSTRAARRPAAGPGRDRTPTHTTTTQHHRPPEPRKGQRPKEP